MIFVRDDRKRNGCFAIADVREHAADIYAVPYGTNDIAGNVFSIDSEDMAVWFYLETDCMDLRGMEPKRIGGDPRKTTDRLSALGFREYSLR